MVFVDIHSHMDWNSFDSDREQILEEMQKNNIITLTNTINQKNYEYTKELFKNHNKTIKILPGLYPQDAENISDIEFDKYLNQIKKNKKNILAIGEIGLDFHHTKKEETIKIANQIKRFKQIIEFANKEDLPIIVHTRCAEKEVLEILEEYKEKNMLPKTCLHCFTGKKKLIEKIKQLNIYCSIPLIIQNNLSFQILVEQLSIKQLLTETDSPFLNPTKERNSPLNIKKVYLEIAKIKNLDSKEIENIIYRNYMKFIM